MSIMTTHSSVRIVRQPMAPATPSNLHAISGLRRLSEQPEDVQSLNTIDAEDLGHDRDQGCRTPPPGGPPGNGPPDDDLDDDGNNPLDDAPNVHDNIDSDELIKKILNILPDHPLRILALKPKFTNLRFMMAWTKLSSVHSSFNVC